jgi:hypothetical protein
MAKNRFQQAVLIGIGIMVAIGFSGIFSYGSLVQTPDTPDREETEIKAELPSQNFQQGSYNLSIQQQAYLAVNEQVVFVNAFYENDSTVFNNIESLTSEFNNKVYINTLNQSETTIGANYQVQTPGTLIVGDQPSRRRPYTLRTSSADKQSIKQEICGSIRDVTPFGATCYS